MTIRKANPSDQKALEKLLIEFDAYTNDYLSPTEKEFMQYKNLQKTVEEAVQEYLSKDENLVYVAEENDMLIGYIYGTVKEKKQRVLDKEGYISEWFISENCRNQNIGGQLLNGLINEFKKSNCTHLSLKAFVENKKAIDLYHHLGFTDDMLILHKKMK